MVKRDTLSVILIGAAALFLAAAVYFAFSVPTAQRETGGHVQRIFYFHVGIAWVAGLALLAALAASILYLARGEQRRHDIVAHASIEIGVVFGVMVIASGMLWARPVWNTWWTWDPRLTTTAITLFIYVAYLMLRGAIDDPQRRARFAAVYTIVFFPSVPITYLATTWWNAIHPNLAEGGAFALSASMRPAMFLSLAAFTLIYVVLLRARMRFEHTADEVALLKQHLLSQ